MTSATTFSSVVARNLSAIGLNQQEVLYLSTPTSSPEVCQSLKSAVSPITQHSTHSAIVRKYFPLEPANTLELLTRRMIVDWAQKSSISLSRTGRVSIYLPSDPPPLLLKYVARSIRKAAKWAIERDVPSMVWWEKGQLVVKSFYPIVCDQDGLRKYQAAEAAESISEEAFERGIFQLHSLASIPFDQCLLSRSDIEGSLYDTKGRHSLRIPEPPDESTITLRGINRGAPANVIYNIIRAQTSSGEEGRISKGQAIQCLDLIVKHSFLKESETGQLEVSLILLKGIDQYVYRHGTVEDRLVII